MEKVMGSHGFQKLKRVRTLIIFLAVVATTRSASVQMQRSIASYKSQL